MTVTLAALVESTLALASLPLITFECVVMLKEKKRGGMIMLLNAYPAHRP